MYKTNRLNHDFQIRHFLAGSCFTADAAYGLMCDLEDDRVMALNAAKVSSLRSEAMKLRIDARIRSKDAADAIEAQADILEYELSQDLSNRNIAAAEAELKTIRDLKMQLEPLRRFAHLPLAQAHEAAQQEEWKLHLLYTAQNMMMSQGSISHDYIGTMRQHPEFESAMLPLIDTWRAEVVNLIHRGGSMQELSFLKAPSYNAAHMLTSEKVPLLNKD